MQTAGCPVIVARSVDEVAANLRTGATFALDDRARGEATTEEVIALYEQVTQLDPSVHWDWVELGRLYQAAGRLSDARQTASQALERASSPRERSVALTEMGDVLGSQGDFQGARVVYEEALAIDRQIAAHSVLDADTGRDLSISLSRVAGVALGLGDANAAFLLLREALQRDMEVAQKSPSARAFLDICAGLWMTSDALVAAGDLPRARQSLELGVGICGQLVADNVAEAPLQLAYTRWRLAGVRAAEGELSLAQDDFSALQSFAEELMRADPSDNEIALQIQLLEISLADIDILGRREEQARRRLNDVVAVLSRARHTSELDRQADAYIWRAQVRLASLPHPSITWDDLEPTWPTVRAMGDISALDFVFIERARTATSH